MKTREARKANRLINETSPYLLQHAYNAVDWHPWGQEALDLARKTDRPIFLSTGYAACHWCHVMEHEIFENDQAATLLNENFISIKVDREERPDLDEIYMNATVIYTRGYGGWPMSVFLTPEMQPFFAGTYFPLLDIDGRPGFLTLLRRIIEAWRLQRADLVHDAGRIAGMIRQMGAAVKGTLVSREALAQTALLIAGSFDMRDGGLSSGGNKFPPSMAMELLLREYRKNRQSRLLQAVEVTLEKMARGGIYDHLGGGICRYSTDPEWLLPHFEKMLYDQALVGSIYLDGYQVTGRKLFADAARGIFDYVLRDLCSPAGAFYSSEDADSEGLEGKFYLWTQEEVRRLLGEQDSLLFAECYDVTESGNWNHPGDRHVPSGPKNILRLVRTPAEAAGLRAAALREIEARLAECRRKLFEARNLRARPALDDKILADWNGLMLSTLAKASLVLDEPRYLNTAAHAASFILESMTADGRLLHCHARGRTRLKAYVSDYAFVIEACIGLFEATGSWKWLEAAERLAEIAVEYYWDAAQGGFFFTASDHEALIHRSKAAADNAIPSGNSVMLMNLLKLEILLGRPDYREKGAEIIRNFGEGIAQSPLSHHRLACGVEAWHNGFLEVLVAGDMHDPRTNALLRVIYSSYLPNKVVVRFDHTSSDAGSLAARLPLLRGRARKHESPVAYVCRDQACQLPATDPQVLAAILEESFQTG